jgi:hypothetical protein
MIDSKECLLITEALGINANSPLKRIISSVVCTKDYYFVVPTQSIGTFVIFDTIKNHSFFDGLSIPEGLKQMIDEATNVHELEDKIKVLLENNQNYIYKLSEAKGLKLKSFLGKKTMMYKRGFGWESFSPKSKDEGKLLVEFYKDIV